MKIDSQIRTVQDHFTSLFAAKGHEIRIAGGAVRDILLNKTPKDIDFATTATPQQMKEIFADSVWAVIETGIEHGTLTAHHSSLGDYEITTLRRDVETDGRHAVVEFTDSWQEDAARRDFTINAMFLDNDLNLYDFFNGEIDLKQGIVRFVGDPNKRIEEDALRMIRFFRMICKFPVITNIHPGLKAVINNADKIKNVSVERVWDEFKKVCQDNPSNVWRFFENLDFSGLSCELKFNILAIQDVLKLDNEFVQKYPEIAAATQMRDQLLTNEFCDRFKLSNNERDNMLFFVKHTKDNDIYEFGFDTATDLINEGVDRELIKVVACYHRNGFLQDGIDSIEETKFPITGMHLMERGFKPGPELGKRLKELKEAWKQSRYKLTKQELLGSL